MRGHAGSAVGSDDGPPRQGPPRGRRRTRDGVTGSAFRVLLAMTLAWPLAPSALAAQQAAPQPATWQAMDVRDDPEPVSTGRATAQVTLGTVGTLGGFVAGGLATRWIARRAGSDEDRASRLADVGALTGAALATPVAPMLLGSQGDVHGSYPAALAGTLVGGAASLAVVAAGRRGAFDCRWCAPLRMLAGVSAFVLPSLGATIAFNRSRR